MTTEALEEIIDCFTVLPTYLDNGESKKLRDQAAAELAQLATGANEFAQLLGELAQLRAENAELREAHARIATMVFALAEDARDFARRTSSAVLGKYPEEETK